MTLDGWRTIMLVIVGLSFGAIHLAAWSFTFPTLAEKWLWRAACLGITVGPVVAMVIIITGVGAKKAGLGSKGWFIVASIGYPIYAASRGILLVLAFTTLRSLPPGALETVRWTTWLPHI
jgi:hypothetical protein